MMQPPEALNTDKIRLELDRSLLAPGLRLAVGVSGGADSVALFLALAELRSELGIVLSLAHLDHSLRGAESDGDREFVRQLAEGAEVEFFCEQVDVAAEAEPKAGKAAESIEEAARRVRYGFFRRLMAEGKVDAVATAHTRDDQAETVLGKLLRGAWIEGLSGVHPEVKFPEGKILRPLLKVSRVEIEAYLGARGAGWREDSSNRELVYTRNRIRHSLLPELERWNPQIRERLSQMADLARVDDAYWQQETEKAAAFLVMEGRPVRGGGRAAGGGWALDLTRFAPLPEALKPRLLRFAVAKFGVKIDFTATAALVALAEDGRAGQKRELVGGIVVERTNRELRFSQEVSDLKKSVGPAEVFFALPGMVEGFGYRVTVSATEAGLTGSLRGIKAGDKIWMRHTSGPRKAKEIFERMKVSGSDRAGWPVLEVAGQILWMRGVEVEPVAGFAVKVEVLG